MTSSPDALTLPTVTAGHAVHVRAADLLGVVLLREAGLRADLRALPAGARGAVKRHGLTGRLAEVTHVRELLERSIRQAHRVEAEARTAAWEAAQAAAEVALERAAHDEAVLAEARAAGRADATAWRAPAPRAPRTGLARVLFGV